MYCTEEDDDKPSKLCFSLMERTKKSVDQNVGQPYECERTEARIGYTFAPRNHPERPQAIPTSAQRTIGTGITHNTY